MKQVLQYVNHTLDDYLTIGANSMTRMDVYIDAAYGVHMDMKEGHTGECISLGRGTLMSKPSKQKLNTKSLTEMEVAGCSDYTPSALWTKSFLDHQGYTIEIDLHQDNQSAMRMTRNCQKTCSHKSRHIDIRCFWLQDRIEKEEINLTYCPTEIIVADFFTKPLHRSLSRKMKAVIMGEVLAQRSVLKNMGKIV